ncbi:MAG: Ig-like domain-containing protein [Candidatus Diapherotrites archaeon]
MRKLLAIFLTIFMAASVFAAAPTAGSVLVDPIYDNGGTNYTATDFSITTEFTIGGGDPAITGCEYTLNNGANWYAATWTVGDTNSCTENITGQTDGTPLTVNMKATNGELGTGTAVAVTVDDTAPVTTPSFTSTNWQTADIAITLACDDATGSGCAETNYCIDSVNTCTPATTYTSEITHSTEGTNYIRFNSTDNVGNEEGILSQILNLDKTEPTFVKLIFDNAQEGEITDTTPSLTLEATDLISGIDNGQMKFSCSGVESEYSDSVSYATTYNAFDLVSGQYGCSTDDGAKTLYVKFSDTAGNWTSGDFNSIDMNWLPVNNSITVTDVTSDSTPEFTLDYAGDCHDILLSCNNNELNTSEWKSIGCVTSYSDFDITTAAYACSTSNGTKTIYSVVKDDEDNYSDIKNDSTNYDTTEPTGSITNDYTSNYTNDETPEFELSADGTGSSVIEMRFSCNESSWTSWVNYSSTYTNFDIDSSSYGCSTGNGTKNVYVQFKDAAENTSTVTIKTEVKYDNSDPDTPTLNTANSRNGEVYLDWDEVSDNGDSGIKHYKIYQNGSEIDTTTDTEYYADGLSNGTEYDFKIRAVDNAGNESSYSNVKSATPEAPSNDDSSDSGRTSSGGGSSCSDTTEPKLDWVFPKDGQKFNKGTIELKVSATDNSTMGSVKFYYDMKFLGSTTSPSSGNNWIYEWDASEKELGNYTIRAIARDACGNATNKEITITLTDEEIVEESIVLEDDNGVAKSTTEKEPSVRTVATTETNTVVADEPSAEEEPSALTMFANLLGSEYIMLGLGLLILAAVALFVVNYMRSGQGGSDNGISNSFGLSAAYRKADKGGFGPSSRSRQSEFLSDLAGKIRNEKPVDKNHRWAYKK